MAGMGMEGCFVVRFEMDAESEGELESWKREIEMDEFVAGAGMSLSL